MSKYLQATIESEAERLDREYPDWFKSIKVDILDLARSDRCILGQAFGDYGTGLRQIGINVHDEVTIAYIPNWDYTPGHEIDLAKKYWVDEIEARLAAEEEASAKSKSDHVLVS